MLFVGERRRSRRRKSAIRAERAQRARESKMENAGGSFPPAFLLDDPRNYAVRIRARAARRFNARRSSSLRPPQTP